MIEEFKNRLKELGVGYCFNEQQYDFSKLKYIIVGDNPGDTEYKEKKLYKSRKQVAQKKPNLSVELSSIILNSN